MNAKNGPYMTTPLRVGCRNGRPAIKALGHPTSLDVSTTVPEQYYLHNF